MPRDAGGSLAIIRKRRALGRTRGAVVEEDDAIGEGFGGEEFEADGAMARLNQGDAFADEDGDDVDAELVDFALVQKGSDDFAAAQSSRCVCRAGRAGAGRKI